MSAVFGVTGFNNNKDNDNDDDDNNNNNNNNNNNSFTLLQRHALFFRYNNQVTSKFQSYSADKNDKLSRNGATMQLCYVCVLLTAVVVVSR